jgi:hypothetical protein
VHHIAPARSHSRWARTHRPTRSVLIVMDGGRPSGHAFVEFPTPAEASAAMAKHRQVMGTRYIEIFPASRADLDR